MCIDFGLSRTAFFAEYQEKKPLLVKKAVKLGDFTWSDVNALFERCNVADDSFKLAYEGIRPKHEYVERYIDIGTPRHRLIKPVVYDYMRKGATLIVNKIKHEPKVSAFARAVGEFTGRQIVSSAYAAFGRRSSFRCHWDTRDVFAIQLIGRKRWIVYPPSFEVPLYMQQSKDLEHLYPCPPEPCMDIVLEPGDVFYLPRGWWHDPLPLGEGSFHLALGTFPAYAVDYLEWAVQEMRQHPDVRKSLEGWEGDAGLMVAIGKHFDAFLKDSANYLRFMDQFHAAKRDESPLALERFGDPEAGPLGDDAALRLRMHQAHGLEQGYLVHDGRKMTLERRVADLVHRLSQSPGLSLQALMAQAGIEDKAWCRQVVTELCRQDVICIINAV